VDGLVTPVRKGNSNLKALFISCIICDSCIALANCIRKLTAASADVPVVHYEMIAACHSVQRREAEAGAATNRTSVSRLVTLSASREAEANVAITSISNTSSRLRFSRRPMHDVSHTEQRRPRAPHTCIRVCVCQFDDWFVTCARVRLECIYTDASNAGVRHGTLNLLRCRTDLRDKAHAQCGERRTCLSTWCRMPTRPFGGLEITASVHRSGRETCGVQSNSPSA
jgi:hypothetical protein